MLHAALLRAADHEQEGARGPKPPQERPLNDLLSEVNVRVHELLGLRPDQAALVSDLVNFRMKLIKGKAPKEATRPPTEAELHGYASQLRDELDAFTDDQPSVWHRVLVGKNRGHGIVSIEVDNACSGAIPIEVIDIKKARGPLFGAVLRPNPHPTQPMGVL